MACAWLAQILPTTSFCSSAILRPFLLQLGINLGLKGLHFLVGELPSWLSYAETEKIEVREAGKQQRNPTFIGRFSYSSEGLVVT